MSNYKPLEHHLVTFRSEQQMMIQIIIYDSNSKMYSAFDKQTNVPLKQKSNN